MCKTLLGGVALLAAVAFAADGPLPRVDRDPVDPTKDEQMLVRQGINLHDQGDFDGAITKYKQALDTNPDYVGALYELGFTYFAKKDYPNALATARRGAQYHSPLLARFHVSIGSVLDDMGNREEAIVVYRAAIEQTPNLALLHFNLGLTLRRAGSLNDARTELERSASLDPKHASSQFVLATTYADMGYRVPAVLAWSRFLLLEPSTDRSRQAVENIQSALAASVRKDEKSGATTIVMNIDSKKDEGDFDAVDVGMSIGLLAAQLGPDKTKPDNKKDATAFEQLASNYSVMADVLSTVKPTGFAARYYAPFFAELGRRGFGEAFIATAFAGARLDGADAWASENSAKLDDFQAWLAAYRWPLPE